MALGFLKCIFAPVLLGDDYSGIAAKYLNSILTTLIYLLSALLIFRLSTQGGTVASTEWMLAALVMINLVLLIVVRRGYLLQAGIGLVFLTWIAITNQAWRADGIYDVVIVTYVILIVLASVLTNEFVEVVVTLMSILGVWGMALYHPNSSTTPSVDTPQNFARDLTIFFLVAGMTIFYLVRILNDSLRQAKKELLERKQLEIVREQLITQLEAQNAELTQFTYTVSHELKTPLVTVKGFADMISRDLKDKKYERAEKDLLRVSTAADNMYDTLTDLLELSRIGRMMNKPADVPFAEIVQEALELVRGRLESQNITVHSQPNLPIVYGDRQRLTEVLRNLIDNAAKCMGDQTNPLIEIGQNGEDAESGHPIFFVRDNGIGIAPEYHERIFGLFNKLDAKVEGTGIGLTLVKRIIEVHGGRIWVESVSSPQGEVGKGSTFYFTLPRLKTDAA